MRHTAGSDRSAATDHGVGRRRLLGSLAGVAGLTGLAGCAGLGLDFGLGSDDPGDTGTGTDSPSTPTSEVVTPAGEAVPLQTVSVRNAGSVARYVTVAVLERASDRAAFVDSRTVQPGGWFQFEDVVGTSGDYRVIIETDREERAVHPWAVDGRLAGLEVVLTEPGSGAGEDGATRIEAWPSVTCGPRTCAVRHERRVGDDLPLPGDGMGYWYAPAAVVLRNDGPARRIDLRVTQHGEAVLDATYDPPAGAQVRVPLTFRSGTYGVTVTAAGQSTSGDWYVPEERSRYVRVDGAGGAGFGCAPTNVALDLANDDDVDREFAVTVRPLRPTTDGTPGTGTETGTETETGTGTNRGATTDGEPAAATPIFDRTVSLAADETRSLTPPIGSGRYVIAVRATPGGQARGMWWTCAPHGRVDVRVDAAGILRIDQEFRQYVADPSRYR